MLDCHEPGNLSFITKLYSVTLGLEATVLKHGPEQKRHSLCYLRGSIGIENLVNKVKDSNRFLINNPYFQHFIS